MTQVKYFFMRFSTLSLDDSTRYYCHYPLILHIVINPRIIENYTPTKCLYLVSHETEVA